MRAMKLSLAVGLCMLCAKVYAFLSTGSAAIFSDAAESIVHNIAVGFALFSLYYSLRPADRNHPYGHDKIGYFSAGFEGSMIVLAGVVIIAEAIRRWLAGSAPENLDTGLAITIGATLVNGALGFYLILKGRENRSLILEANGRHVLTDSWTSLGVIVGLLLTRLTGWWPFDPICAIIVALNIFGSGLRLMLRSYRGLMDEADPDIEATLTKVLDEETVKRGITYHELRHRESGPTTWVDVHLLFPDETPLRIAHEQATEIEARLDAAIDGPTHVTTHLEPAVDHARVHNA